MAHILAVILVLSAALQLHAAERIELRVDEPVGTARQAGNWPIIVGVALPEGALTDIQQARVVDSEGDQVLSQFEAAAHWGFEKASVKWLLVDTLVQLNGTNTPSLFLEYGPDISRKPVSSPLGITEDMDTYVVSNGVLEVTISKWAFRLFDRVRRDLDGDGTFGESETFLRAGDDCGIFWIDQDGTRYDAWRDNHEMTWEIEKNGPVRITLRCEGWFVDAGGRKVMKQITRMRFHPFADWVKVFQTFVWTVDEKTEIKQITMRAGLSGTSTGTSTGIDGRSLTFGGGLTLLQDRYDHLRWQADGKAGDATRWDGWVETSVPVGRIIAMLRDCPEQQPKGTRIEGDRFDIHLYPPHEKLLSTREEARLTRQHRKHPTWEKNRQYSFDPKNAYRYKPVGFAKTHEIVYRFVGPAAPPRAGQTTHDLIQRPVVAHADPERVCAAQPFGFYIPPRNVSRWPAEEALVDAVYRWGGRYDEEMDPYEIMNFGDVIWNRGPGREAAHYRYWGNQSKGWVNAPWYLFARSGERYYAIRGEQHARHVMDLDTVTHGARSGSWIWPRVTGAQWVYASVHFGWAAGLLPLWAQHEYLYYHYYFTGYERAQRMAQELEKSILASDYDRPTTYINTFYKESPGGQTVPFDPATEVLGEGERIARFSRGQYNTIWQLAALAANSGNGRFLELARRYQAVALLNVTRDGLFRGNYMNLAQSQVRFHALTGDPATRKAIVRHAKGHPRKELLSQAYAYSIAKSPELLAGAVSRLSILAKTTDLGPDAFNRGAFPGGTQSAGDRFFLGALITLGHMESSDNVAATAPRGLFVNGGPTGRDTGPKTGKYLRVAYVLQQEDKEFDLDVQFGGGYQWDVKTELSVTAPSGKGVLSKQMVPRVDRTEQEGYPTGSGHYNAVARWRVAVPADGETGVYAVTLVCQQQEGLHHAGIGVRVTSSTGKLVWHVPTERFTLNGDGRLWLQPAPAATHLRIAQYRIRPPYVLRLYDPGGEEAGVMESVGPDPERDMQPVVEPIEVPLEDTAGLWSILKAGSPWVGLESLGITGALPFYSMSKDEWFDPRVHGITLK